jgi:hypothetical protein
VATNGGFTQVSSSLRHLPAVGYHFYAWLEFSPAVSITNWAGDNGGTVLQTGIHGTVMG